MNSIWVCKYFRSRSRRRAKWGLEDNIVWYGQEKKKLWVIIAICLLSLRLFLTHHRIFDSQKNKERYIFMTKCCRSSFNHYITKSMLKETLQGEINPKRQLEKEFSASNFCWLVNILWRNKCRRKYSDMKPASLILFRKHRKNSK